MAPLFYLTGSKATTSLCSYILTRHYPRIIQKDVNLGIVFL